MAYDLKKEEDVKDYVENLGIEYRFGCYKEKKPQVCHLLGDYLEAIKKDFDKAARVFKNNCLEYNYGKSCLKIGNYTLVGKGRSEGNASEALTYFEKGCELDEPVACLHAGMLLSMHPKELKTVQHDFPKGFNYLKKSCDRNIDKACYFLSGMYIRGVIKDNSAPIDPYNKKNQNVDYLIRPDMKEAFRFSVKACELGSIPACANVSMMFAAGDGVKKNEEQSKKYRNIAVELQKAHETTKEMKFQQGLN